MLRVVDVELDPSEIVQQRHKENRANIGEPEVECLPSKLHGAVRGDRPPGVIPARGGRSTDNSVTHLTAGQIIYESGTCALSALSCTWAREPTSSMHVHGFVRAMLLLRAAEPHLSSACLLRSAVRCRFDRKFTELRTLFNFMALFTLHSKGVDVYALIHSLVIEKKVPPMALCAGL